MPQRLDGGNFTADGQSQLSPPPKVLLVAHLDCHLLARDRVHTKFDPVSHDNTERTNNNITNNSDTEHKQKKCEKWPL